MALGSWAYLVVSLVEEMGHMLGPWYYGRYWWVVLVRVEAVGGGEAQHCHSRALVGKSR